MKRKPHPIRVRMCVWAGEKSMKGCLYFQIFFQCIHQLCCFPLPLFPLKIVFIIQDGSGLMGEKGKDAGRKSGHIKTKDSNNIFKKKIQTFQVLCFFRRENSILVFYHIFTELLPGAPSRLKFGGNNPWQGSYRHGSL